jgi:hypothetical protein
MLKILGETKESYQLLFSVLLQALFYGLHAGTILASQQGDRTNSSEMLIVNVRTLFSLITIRIDIL